MKPVSLRDLMLKAPFPYFGGKSRIAPVVWQRFGNVPNYVEPFFGSGAVLLSRPGWSSESTWTETVNDKDAMVCNFWRAVVADPDAVADFADWPSNESDLTARHVWLKARKADLSRKLEGDPDFFDAKIAGWWVWGMACWIGHGWCDDKVGGPWVVQDGQLVHLGDAGQGVQRRRVHLGNTGEGVQRRRVHLGDAGRGDPGSGECGLLEWIRSLADRLLRVRVVCGDWNRVCGQSVTVAHGITGVFLDPPYSAEANRDKQIYAEEDLSIAHEVREWALEWGRNPLMRIALCGYEGEHNILATHGWSVVEWKARGGMANLGNGAGKDNCKRERVWFSPACIKPEREVTILDLIEEAS